MLEESPSSLGYPTTNNLLTSDVGPNDCDMVFKFPKSCHKTKADGNRDYLRFICHVIYVGTPLHCPEGWFCFMRELNNWHVIIVKMIWQLTILIFHNMLDKIPLLSHSFVSLKASSSYSLRSHDNSFESVLLLRLFYDSNSKTLEHSSSNLKQLDSLPLK